MSKVATRTLAQLYEAQNQFIDAYVIYQQVFRDAPDDELQKKICQLREAIFDKVVPAYDQVTSLLFTDAEKRAFRILPTEAHKEYVSARQDIAEEASNPDLIKKEDELPSTSVQEILETVLPDELNDEDQLILERGNSPESVSLANPLWTIQEKKQ